MDYEYMWKEFYIYVENKERQEEEGRSPDSAEYYIDKMNELIFGEELCGICGNAIKDCVCAKTGRR